MCNDRIQPLKIRCRLIKLSFRRVRFWVRGAVPIWNPSYYLTAREGWFLRVQKWARFWHSFSVLVLSHGSHINHITDSLLPSADDLAKIQLLVDVKLQCGHPNVFESEPATSAVCVDVHSAGCRVSRALSEVFGEVWRSLTARLPAHGKVQHHGWRFGLQSNYKGCAP